MIDLTVLAPALAAIVTAGLASIGTYVSMRRAKSGQINSTEADQLWVESSAIRRELREQIQQMEMHIVDNEARIDALRQEILALRAENATLKHEVLTLREENATLKQAIGALKQENVELRAKQQQQATRIEEVQT